MNEWDHETIKTACHDNFILLLRTKIQCLWISIEYLNQLKQQTGFFWVSEKPIVEIENCSR